MWNRIFIGPDVLGGLTKWGLFWRGIAFALLGFLFALAPLLSLATLALLVGWYFFFGGLWTAMSALFRKTERGKWILYGILFFLIGLYLVVNPGVDFVFLAIATALMFVSSGMIGLYSVFSEPAKNSAKWLNGISSLLSIVLGILLIVWPIAGMYELVWVSGILFLIEGLFTAVAAFLVKIK